MICASFTPKAITFGSLLKAAINTGLAKYTIIPTISAIEILQRIPIRAPFFALSYFFAAQILTDKCGQPHRKTGNRQKTKSLNLGICPASSNSQLAEAVDIRLHYHVCNSDHGILDAQQEDRWIRSVSAYRSPGEHP